MHIYLPYMKAMVPTIKQGALYTYLTYITYQKWLLHSNIAHMANILYGHKDQIFLYTYAKTYPTATITSHVIVNYVPKVTMPTKFGFLPYIFKT